MIKKIYSTSLAVTILGVPYFASAAIEDDVADLIQQVSALTQRVTALETPVLDDNTSYVLLRTSCGDSDNCFTDIATLQNWLSNRSVPTEKILVDIGAGEFSGTFSCFNNWNMTLRGSGRDVTVLNSQAPSIVTFPDCTLNVQDLKITSPLIPVNASATSGVTTWTNVELVGGAYGWSEASCPVAGESRAKHFWFSSRVIATTGFGQARGYSSCSENWFFGSEITAQANVDNMNEAAALVLLNSETHVYGSVIRVVAGPGVSLQPGAASVPKTVDGIVVVGAYASEVHIHGTGIDIISPEPNDVIALLAGDAATSLHVVEAAFSLSTGNGGTITRVSNPQNSHHVHASYTWPATEEPPAIVSYSGWDTYIETDCDSNGICVGVPATQQQPHQMVYSSNCTTNGPWFNMVTQACR